MGIRLYFLLLSIVPFWIFSFEFQLNYYSSCDTKCILTENWPVEQSMTGIALSGVNNSSVKSCTLLIIKSRSSRIYFIWYVWRTCFKQTVGIPMWTNCATRLPYLFLYFNKADFIQEFLMQKKKEVTSIPSLYFPLKNDDISLKIQNLMTKLNSSTLLNWR